MQLLSLKNISLSFFTLQTQRKKATSASHTQNLLLRSLHDLSLPRLPLIYRHRRLIFRLLIWFFSSLFLSFSHCKRVFIVFWYTLSLNLCEWITVCVWSYTITVFWLFCWVLNLWPCVWGLWVIVVLFLLLSFESMSLTVCVGAYGGLMGYSVLIFIFIFFEAIVFSVSLLLL